MKTINLSKYVPSFLEKTKGIHYAQQGAFKSELFLLYCLHKEFENDMFIESGLCNGFSTQILLSLIKDPYVGIDSDKRWRGREKSEIKTAKDFTFQHGNSIQHLPQTILRNPNKQISVFIDGPKNTAAMQLKDKILSYTNVSFVAVHDTYDGLVNQNKLRIFESSSNKKYNAKYFELLNRAQGNEADIFSLVNSERASCRTVSYAKCYPNGPGISIYSKHDVKFEL